jgi:hypothetical protein
MPVAGVVGGKGPDDIIPGKPGRNVFIGCYVLGIVELNKGGIVELPIDSQA